MAASSTTHTGLVDMPCEIVEHIVGFIDRPDDLARWSSAVGVVATAQAQMELLVEAVPIDRLLSAGAPLHTVCRRPREPFCDRHLRCAMVGGRADVVMWLVDEGNSNVNVYEIGRRMLLCIAAACESGAHKMLQTLLAQRIDLTCDRSPWFYDHATRCALEAGDKDALALIHDAAIRHLGRCQCGRAAKHAIKTDDAALAAWLYQHRDDVGLTCDEAHNIVHHVRLDQLVYQGKLALARWLLTARPAVPDAERLRKGQIVAAARAGRLDIVAFAHVNGLYRCPLRALVVAARCGRTDILSWALGDAIDRVEPAPQAPITSWCGAHVAYSAAERRRFDVIAWMASRADTRAAIMPSVARCAFCRGAPVDLMIDFDRNGTAPFSQWDPLETAIKYRGTHELKVLLTARALYKKGVIMQAALARPRHDILAYLCKECGPDGLQGAVDVFCGLSSKCLANILWMRDYIGAVCVADALASCKVDRSCCCRSCRRPRSSFFLVVVAKK
ncbi:hypothetical protein psal_cds_542 [Pandoravirus salinus]|uniref:Ankyrin repeat domain containing protein n=1 Tax=Pandoravirus salinus TaxID=1349410 RepID=S4W1S1_9VIRU|nr:hypothetical protein psal_cds_542 [Pandoravirus salinus]AGO84382.1 hypothetical protein psal_cds_542 [Pandoravirus salinus]